jgi:LPS export ABC transporter protein LptC
MTLPAAALSAGIAAVIISLSSCSLDYGKAETSEDVIPELSFTDANFNRFEDNRQTMHVQAEKIEQYKNENSSYARKVQFKTWNKQGEPDTEGSCGLVAADSKNEQYNLFDSISVKLYGQNIRLVAENLRFNGKTEQLTSGKYDTVSVERDGVSVSGKGFSASGVSRIFAFASNVAGTITTKENSGTNQTGAPAQAADVPAGETNMSVQTTERRASE